MTHPTYSTDQSSATSSSQIPPYKIPTINANHRAILSALSRSKNPIRMSLNLEPTLADRICALEQTLYGTLSHSACPLPLGNPSPLGLFGFASASLLTAVLKISSDKSAQMSGTLAATAIFLGGFAQLLTAIFQLLKNHTHAATSFGLYGFHWLSVGFQIWVNSLSNADFITPQSSLSSATYSGVLAAMTFFLWVPTVRMNAVLSSLFIGLFLVFLTEIPAAYGVRAAEVASGIVQAAAGSLGAYLAVLDMVNETWRRPILPLFPCKEHRAEYEGTFEDGYIPRKTYYKSACSSSIL